MQLNLILFVAFITTVLCAPNSVLPREETCDVETCQPPNCRCLSTSVPGGLEPSEIPQLVLLTFDDAVTAENYAYYEESFFGRTNPDGCPVAATYFMTHEYTDYSKVHNLHAKGHEIALHSITHEALTTYWDQLDLAGFIAEFGGQIEMLKHFSGVPAEDVHGMRVPFLQLSGDTSFQAVKELGMTYDASWPTQSFMNPPLWPYTLDYISSQDCPIGRCPTSPIPGVWVQPMVNWEDDGGSICSMVDACVNIPLEVDGLVEFMKRNFNRHYETNRSPFGFYVHSGWFRTPEHYEAYNIFLDYLQTLNDVYIVGVNRAIEWVRNPTRTRDLKALWSECQPTHEPNCVPKTCELMKDNEYRYLTHCASSCPVVYPWLDNPLGN